MSRLPAHDAHLRYAVWKDEVVHDDGEHHGIHWLDALIFSGSGGEISGGGAGEHSSNATLNLWR